MVEAISVYIPELLLPEAPVRVTDHLLAGTKRNRFSLATAQSSSKIQQESGEAYIRECQFKYQSIESKRWKFPCEFTSSS